MQLTNGTLLQGGKYKIESMLGQGAYGITYLATTKVKGPLGDIPVKVAIKEFFSKELNTRKVDGNVSEVSSDSLAGKYSNMFLREARNLSHLKHDGIVNVLEAFSENNTHYYVMEYVDGGSLDAYIRSKGRLSERETLSLARQISSALAFMHENKMLHLDLKPKNIMLRADGTLCLIDFGLSKQYQSDGEPESSTTIGLGTPGYAPIEQGSSDDRKSFAPTLDIYAFGATLFKMLTGKTPPRSSDIFNEGFPAGELLSLEISEETITAIRHAMSPRKDDRPQSVEEFLALLKDPVKEDDELEDDDEDNDSEDTELEDDETEPEDESDDEDAELEGEEPEDTEVTDEVDNNNDLPIWKILLKIIDLVASFVFPIFGLFVCLILFGIGDVWCAFILFVVSLISTIYSIRLRKDFRSFWVFLIIYVPIVIVSLIWIAEIILF